MNIGITTFHWANNYGAVLQAHALQTALQNRGHAVELIDYRPQRPLPFLRRWLSLSSRGRQLKREANRKAGAFEAFRRQRLVRSPQSFYSLAELASIRDRYDLVITGSDQVWNPKWLEQSPGFVELYFLNFVGPQTRRISYAASLGHASTETLTPKWQQILGNRLNSLDGISVREASGVSLVQQLSGRKDAKQVCDPTLLLPAEHYRSLFNPKFSGQPYLFSFMLHGRDEDATQVAKHLAQQRGLQIIRCNATKTSRSPGYDLPDPAGWLSCVYNADFVVTNSFHCAVFCLLFQVPFLSVLISGELGSMNSRLVDLLQPLGLAGRAQPPGPLRMSDEDLEHLPWDAVRNHFDRIRLESLAYLEVQGC